MQCSDIKNKIHESKKGIAVKLDYAIAIHGGAGNFDSSDIPKEIEEQYRDKLQEVLNKGLLSLKNNDKAVDVVVQVISMMEDSPLFNAGKGAVFTHSETNELDASIMNGNDLNAGAVACVTNIKNPIKAAQAVMLQSKHVFLVGKGASEFAKEQNLEIVDPEYFYTKKSYNKLQKAIKTEKYGTVGCVVLDKYGNLAAGTSTGGITNKKYGRIGDSPIIGAGTYANNNTCAVSATGQGEYFIRQVAAYNISALMEYGKLSLKEAADNVVNVRLKNMKASGGIISLDKFGTCVFSFNTTGMFRAYANSKGKNKVLLYENEK